MKSRSILPAALACLTLNLPATLRAVDPTVFGPEYNIDVPNSGDATVEIKGRLHSPPDTSTAKPLILFFHGLGQTGTDNEAQVRNNMDELFNKRKNNSYIYAPQCTETSWTPAVMKEVMTAVGKILTDWDTTSNTFKYNIARNKIYVTGLSLGGGGTWTCLMHYPIFAAGVPICGTTSLGGLPASTLANVPIWAFHAVNDPGNSSTTLVGKTRTKVNDIRNNDGWDHDGSDSLAFPLNDTPGEPFYNTGSPYYTDGSTFYDYKQLRYTEYSSGGHNIWGRVYSGDAPEPTVPGSAGALYTWLDQQQKPNLTLKANRTILFDFGTTVLPSPTTDKQGFRVDSISRTWNCTGASGAEQVAGTPVRPAFAKDSTGEQTTVTLRIASAFAGNQNTGVTTGTLPVYDPNVLTDAWRTNANTPAGITIFGLAPGATYNLSFFATENDADGAFGRAVRYYVDATHKVDLSSQEVVGNVNVRKTIPDVQADSLGRITFQVMPNAGSRYGLIGALEITRP